MSKEQRYWLTDNEVEQLLVYRSVRYAIHRDISVIALLMSCGLAYQEVLNLKWTRLFKYNNNNIVSSVSSHYWHKKNQPPRNVYLLPKYLKKVDHWRNIAQLYDIDYVVPVCQDYNQIHNYPLSLRGVVLRMGNHTQKILNVRLGIKNFKHTYVRLALEQGLSIETMYFALQHISIKRTEDLAKKVYFQMDQPFRELIQ